MKVVYFEENLFEKLNDSIMVDNSDPLPLRPPPSPPVQIKRKRPFVMVYNI